MLITVVLALLSLLAFLSIVLNLWQWWAGRRFPLHEQPEASSFSPGVSILRPCKGADSETAACLESWFLQKHSGDYEILFGVASENDPVCGVIRGLISKHPDRDARLLICQPILGTNAKVSSLCYLERKARFEHLVIADQDVYVKSNFLGSLIQPLSDKSVGLVNCFYILEQPRNLGMRLESVAVNADFWSQVLQGNMLKPMDFALGAVMATRKSNLAQIGGFQALLDYLADDYQLGHRIAEAGAKVDLSRVPVHCRSEEQTFIDVWKHQLRWARTIRVCQPGPYFLSILSNGTLWPLLACALHSPLSTALLAVGLSVRMITAAGNYRRLTREPGWSAFLLAPIKDLLQTVVWALSFLGNEITWRGQRFSVDKGGKLTPAA